MRFEYATSVCVLTSVFAFLTTSLVPSSAVLAADCHTGDFRFVGDRTDVEGSTRHDEICELKYGKKSDITNYSVVQKPSHGTIGSAGNQSNRYMTAYRPNPGYVGDDNFSVKINYIPRATGISHSTVVHVHMTVSP
jgi:hypothetical protein